MIKLLGNGFTLHKSFIRNISLPNFLKSRSKREKEQAAKALKYFNQATPVTIGQVIENEMVLV